MSYLVLARKFRPQTFAEIIGQDHVTRTLANAIASGRVHHAFLFCGARGVGKTTAARILAKCLSCVNAPTPTPCNQCDACREITAGTSVDVQEIDGASNNSVDDVRTLRESIRYLPVRSRRKVYIIDEVHMLSAGAFNALLKTLEEPPPHALFIFATTEVHKVPITILSRLQRYDFRLVPAMRIADHLADVLGNEGIAAPREALMLVAREAAGSVRDALSLLEQVIAMSDGTTLDEGMAAQALGVADRGMVRELGRAVVARDPAAALTLVDHAVERAYDLQHLAKRLLEHLRDLIVARAVADPAPLIDAAQSEIEELVAAARELRGELLEMLFDRFARVVDEMARAAMPRYALEVGLIELCRVEPLEPVGKLVERLVQLETRLLVGGHAGGAAGEPKRPSTTDVARGSSANPSPSRSAPSAASARPSRPSSSDPAPPPPAERASAATKPPPAAAAQPVQVSDWPSLAQLLCARKPQWAVLLEGEMVKFAPADEVVVAFPSALSDIVQRLHGDIQTLVRELLGTNVRLQFVEGKGAAPSAMAIEEDARRTEHDRRRQVALGHPARQAIREAFGEVEFKDPTITDSET